MNNLQIQKNDDCMIKHLSWNILSEETRKAYQSDYDLFFKFVNKSPKDITQKDFYSYIEHLKKNNYRNSSISRKIASISKFMDVLVMAGELIHNPVKELKKLTKLSFKTIPNVNPGLTRGDIQKLYTFSEEDTVFDKRIKLIIKTLANTALRISELINIKNSDIKDHDKEYKIINILGKGNKEGIVYIKRELVEEIREYFPVNDNGYLFYTKNMGPYDRRCLWIQITKLSMQILGRKVNPHKFRHAWATIKLKEDGLDIKQVSLMLRHSTPATTTRFYIDSVLDTQKLNLSI